MNNKELFIGKGVIQGGVLSPTLFLIMFNDLLNELEEAGFDIFAYADDLAIVGQGMDNLSTAIRITESWALRNLMTINKRKSGIIMHKSNA